MVRVNIRRGLAAFVGFSLLLAACSQPDAAPGLATIATPGSVLLPTLASELPSTPGPVLTPMPGSEPTPGSEPATANTELPDLVVSAIQWQPAMPAVGANVLITVTVQNHGARQSKATQLILQIEGESVDKVRVGTIDAGGTAEARFAWTRQKGVNTFGAWIDPENQIEEGDENNNRSQVNFGGSILADLFVDSIKWVPEHPSTGDRVTFTVTVANAGTQDSRDFEVEFYVDGSVSRYSSDRVKGVAAGGATQATFSWTARPGRHTFIAIADARDSINESNETNNIGAEMYIVTSLADLLVEGIEWTPAEPSVGDEVEITVRVANRGAGSAYGSLVDLFLDDRTTRLTSDPIDSLLPDKVAVVKFTWSALPGEHIFTAVADARGFVAESDESNNEFEARFGPTLESDLVVESIKWTPENPLEGDKTTFVVTVRNRGPGNARGSIVEYYVDDSQTRLTSDPLDSIPAGGSAMGAFIWAARAGDHTFRAVADARGSVDESDETNNELTVTYSGTFTSDLVVERVAWVPQSPSARDAVKFTITIGNRGSGRALGFSVDYFMDDRSRPLISSSVSAIEPGRETLETLTWVAEPGQHTFSVVLDAGDRVIETNETNNEWSVALPNITR